jgi:hypothetical protein
MFLCAEQTNKADVPLFFKNNSYFLLDESILERITFNNNTKFFCKNKLIGIKKIFFKS